MALDDLDKNNGQRYDSNEENPSDNLDNDQDINQEETSNEDESQNDDSESSEDSKEEEEKEEDVDEQNEEGESGYLNIGSEGGSGGSGPYSRGSGYNGGAPTVDASLPKAGKKKYNDEDEPEDENEVEDENAIDADVDSEGEDNDESIDGMNSDSDMPGDDEVAGDDDNSPSDDDPEDVDEDEDDDDGSVTIGNLVKAGAKKIGFIIFNSVIAPVVTAILPYVIVVILIASLLGVGTVAISSAVNDAKEDACTAPVEEPDDDSAASKKQLYNASVMYTILNNNGYSDEQIAGVLGNMEVESGIDPTSVEGIFLERYTIGDRKQAALDDYDTYSRSLSTFNSNYLASDGKAYGGLGMVQWTAGNAKKLLETAEEQEADWYDMAFQTSYMVTHGSPTGYENFWSEYKESSCTLDTSGGTQDENNCATFFSVHYEGQSVNGMSQRQLNANDWYDAIQSGDITEVDVSSDYLGEADNADGNDSDTSNICGESNSSSGGEGGVYIDDGILTTIPLDEGVYSISQGYGETGNTGYYVRHDGIDMATAAGTPIYAAQDGVVTEAQSAEDDVSGFGNHVYIEHELDSPIDDPNGGSGEISSITTIYGHMRDMPMVSTGDTVTAGQQIGVVGSTGQSTGNHLHFQVSNGGWDTADIYDPEQFLPISEHASGGSGGE